MVAEQLGNRHDQRAMATVPEILRGLNALITLKYGGTGLGLVISRRFCQMMGGDITVASDFITLLGGAAAWPLSRAHSSQKSCRPSGTWA